MKRTELYRFFLKMSRKKLKKIIQPKLAKTAQIDSIRGKITYKAVKRVFEDKSVFKKRRLKENLFFLIKGTAAGIKLTQNEKKEICVEIFGLRQNEKQTREASIKEISSLIKKVRIEEIDVCIDTKTRLFPSKARVIRNIRDESFYFEAKRGFKKILSYNKKKKESKKYAKIIENDYRLEFTIPVKNLKKNKKTRTKKRKKKGGKEKRTGLKPLIAHARVLTKKDLKKNKKIKMIKRE